MSKRYTFTRTIDTPDGRESFSAVEFDSFDEARNAVDRGINDRKIQINERLKSEVPKEILQETIDPIIPSTRAVDEPEA